MRLFEHCFYFVIDKSELSEDAEDIGRRQFSCSHINGNDSFFPSCMTNQQPVVSFAFSMELATVLFQDMNQCSRFQRRDVLRYKRPATRSLPSGVRCLRP